MSKLPDCCTYVLFSIFARSYIEVLLVNRPTQTVDRASERCLSQLVGDVEECVSSPVNGPLEDGGNFANEFGSHLQSL